LPSQGEGGPAVTIGGLHGVGKSTYARRLAEATGLRYVSTGMIFRGMASEKGLSLVELTELSERNPEIDRVIDEVSVAELRRGGVLLDSLLAAWFARDYEAYKILLTAPFEVRVGRIAGRDGKSMAEAEAETRRREVSEAARWKRYYGFDINALSLYDLVLNTAVLPIELNFRLLERAVKGYLEVTQRGGLHTR